MLSDRRGALEADDLIKIILVLVVVWLAIEIIEEIIGALFGPFANIIGLIVIVAIVLWYFDYI